MAGYARDEEERAFSAWKIGGERAVGRLIRSFREEGRASSENGDGVSKPVTVRHWYLRRLWYYDLTDIQAPTGNAIP